MRLLQYAHTNIMSATCLCVEHSRHRLIRPCALQLTPAKGLQIILELPASAFATSAAHRVPPTDAETKLASAQVSFKKHP